MDNYKDYAAAAISEQLPQEVSIKYSLCERVEKHGDVFFAIAGWVNGADNLIPVLGTNCELVIREFVARVKAELSRQKAEAAIKKNTDNFFNALGEILSIREPKGDLDEAYKTALTPINKR